jgi:hypothetical protein
MLFMPVLQPTVIVALIAALVSIASVAANIHIARKARQSAIQVMQAKAHIDRVESSNQTLQQIEIESERLRIRCWAIVSYVRQVAAHPDGVIKDQQKFQDLTENFVSQAQEFLDRWASAKANIPEGNREYIAKLRHDCRHDIEEIEEQCAKNLKRGRFTPESSERMSWALSWVFR